MEKFCGLIDNSLGSLIIISLPENEEDSLKEWFRIFFFFKKKVMENKPDRRISGHQFSNKNVSKPPELNSGIEFYSLFWGVVPCC